MDIAALRELYPQYEAQLLEWLTYPSISAQPPSPQAMEDCARWTAAAMRRAGLTAVEILPTLGHPAVLGRSEVRPDRPTVLIYGHYDVQPVDPVDLWETPPFAPRLAHDRVYARGASDDKGQVMVQLAALDALYRQEGCLPVNVVMLVEGEEEIGSPHLRSILLDQVLPCRPHLAVVSDTAMWAEGVPAITTGLRGMTLLDVTLTGPQRDLHSGTYGGAVANPLEVLSRLLAGLKDADGTINIPGFLDTVRPMTAKERAELARVPFDEAAYRQDLGVAALEGGEWQRPVLERLWFRPTLEINGMWGGFQGAGSKTVLPAQAHAKLSMRLVPDQDPQDIADLVASALRQRAPASVQVAVHRHPGGGRAVVVDEGCLGLDLARQALEQSFAHPALLIREGASIPVVADFKQLLGVDTLLIGFALPDCRAHSPNESLHLPTFRAGIASMVRFYHGLAAIPDWQRATDPSTD
ncbi:MAG: dipeptidase [Magnetococcus sp. WYHC-3]